MAVIFGPLAQVSGFALLDVSRETIPLYCSLGALA
jgi:hypothetical protein